MGARVFVREAIGTPEAHTVFAYEEARGEWLLGIDADEFLSDGLRAALRQLVQSPGVNGYEFLWRIWDGERYITEHGPYKRSLYRRCATHVLGLIHSVELVDPPVQRTELALEALHLALGQRHPQPGTLVHHTDRGSQYTAQAYQAVLEPGPIIALSGSQRSEKSG